MKVQDVHLNQDTKTYLQNNTLIYYKLCDSLFVHRLLKQMQCSDNNNNDAYITKIKEDELFKKTKKICTIKNQ